MYSNTMTIKIALIELSSYYHIKPHIHKVLSLALVQLKLNWKLTRKKIDQSGEVSSVSASCHSLICLL